MSLKVVDQITDYLKVAIPDLFNPVTQLIYRICKVTSAGANGNTIKGSLTELSKPARVEPFTIISSDLMVGQEYMPDVLDTVLSVFSAYYLQAIALDTEVNGIKVAKYLDKFSPSRSADNVDIIDETIVSTVGTAAQLGLLDPMSMVGKEEYHGVERYGSYSASELEVDPPYLNSKNYYFSLPFRSNKITLEASNNTPFKMPSEILAEKMAEKAIPNAVSDATINNVIDDIAKNRREGIEIRQKITQVNSNLKTASNATNPDQALIAQYQAELQRLHNDSRVNREKQGILSDRLKKLTDAQIEDQVGRTKDLRTAKINEAKERVKQRTQNEYNKKIIEDTAIREIKDASNQAVGKVLNVTLTLDGKRVTIPVTVRLIAVPASPERVGSIMAGKKMDQDFASRWKRWRAGRIEFFKDLILCQDLIDEHKKRLMEDDGGVLMAIEQRKTQQTKASIANEDLSIADATNIFIISKDVEKIIEKTIGGKLSSPGVRNKIFAQTYGMIFVVIDKAYERIIIYTRGVAMPATFSFRDLRNKTRNSSDGGVMDLLRQLSMGNPPTF